MGGKGHHPSSSESDDWGDESWIVDCPCGVNYDDGEEMVECDECGVWVHTACCRVPKGLPTYNCDKCKAKKIQETAESEVAQLLTELPGKTVMALDGKHTEKGEACTEHVRSFHEQPLEKRAHVHGIPGGDPSFFEGVPKAFSQQLWKATGYVPKKLNIKYTEIPSVDVDFDIASLLTEIVPLEELFWKSRSNQQKSVFRTKMPEELAGSFKTELLSDGVSRAKLADELSESLKVGARRKMADGLAEAPKVELRLKVANEVPGTSKGQSPPLIIGDQEKEESVSRKVTLHDKQEKVYQVTKVEGKHGKHRHKARGKEDRAYCHTKRNRDEGWSKDLTSRNVLRSNVDTLVVDDVQTLVDVSPPTTVGKLSKSPQSSPKNPKAMKKLAVQEFVDGDMNVCGRCRKVEPVVGGRTFFTGSTAAAGRFEAGLCQDCGKMGGSPREAVQAEGSSIKQEIFKVYVPRSSNTPSPSVIKGNHASVKRQTMDGPADSTKVPKSWEDGKHVYGGGANMLENLLKASEIIGNECSVERTSGEVHQTDIGIFSKPESMKRKGPSERVTLCAKTEHLSDKRQKLESRAGDIHEVAESLIYKLGASPPHRKYVVKSEDVCLEVQQVPFSNSYSEELHKLPQTVHTGHTVRGGFTPSPSGSIQETPTEIPKPKLLVSVLNQPKVLCRASSAPLEVVDVHSTYANLHSEGYRFSSPQNSRLGVVTSVDLAAEDGHPSLSESRGQGSARTSGHFPASGREKLSGDRITSLLQFSDSGVSQSLAGPAHALFTVVPATPTSHRPVSTSVNTTSVTDVKQEIRNLSPVVPSRQLGISVTTSHLVHGQEYEHQLPMPQEQELLSTEHVKHKPIISGSSQQEVCDCVELLSGEMQDVTPMSPSQTTICQQARQSNGHGHALGRLKAASTSVATNSVAFSYTQGHAGAARVSTGATNAAKAPGSSSVRSPVIGSSSSPSSLLIPFSRPQQLASKMPGSPPPTPKSGTPSTTAKVSKTTHPMSTKPSPPGATNKPLSSLQLSKSAVVVSGTTVSKKLPANAVKNSSRSSSFPASKPANSGTVKSPSIGSGPRGSGQCLSPSSTGKGSNKQQVNASSKSISSGRNPSTVLKPVSSSKVTCTDPSPKSGTTSSGGKQHTVPASSSSKSSANPLINKNPTISYSKLSASRKEDKSSMPPLSVSKATTMPPPPQTASKLLSPTILTSPVATTLNDEELALLLHQELNSSPRVPRVPRVRQAGAALQLAASAQVSLLTSKRLGSNMIHSLTANQKDQNQGQRKRIREDRQKELLKNRSAVGLETNKIGIKLVKEKSEGVTVGTDKVEKASSSGVATGSSTKEKSGSAAVSFSSDDNPRCATFAKSNLLIVVPPGDNGVLDVADNQSPAEQSIVTLPGLVDEVLSSKGHQLSYEDVCEAVQPHWPKLRKPNGERYAYASHRQAVLDCLRNRSAWAHLVDRGPKSNLGQKRRRNDSMALSDLDEDERLDHTFQGREEGLTTTSSKQFKDFDGERPEGTLCDVQKSIDLASVEDAPKGRKKVQRRRRLALEDGTDGEDDCKDEVGKKFHSKDEPNIIKDNEEDMEDTSSPSPSSEEAGSNYSEEDEEMVVRREVQRRRQTDSDSSSGDDVD